MNFLKSRKLEKEKLDSLSEIEKIRELEKEKSINKRLESLIFKKFKEIGLEDKINDLDNKLEDVADKMDEMKFIFESNSRSKNSSSVRKLRVKEMMSLLLEQHGTLSAPQLSKLLNLSRTRCSEYLKEMEIKGVLASDLNCRKRYYKLRQ